jgi:hypothetical protein
VAVDPPRSESGHQAAPSAAAGAGVAVGYGRPGVDAAAGETDPTFPLFIRLAAIAGGRRGELHAIRFTDVVTKNRVVELRRNYVRAGGVWTEKASTKTGRAPISTSTKQR